MRALIWVIVSIIIGLSGLMFFNGIDDPFTSEIIINQKQSKLIAGILILLPISAILDISMESSDSSVSKFSLAILVLLLSLVAFIIDKDVFGQLNNENIRFGLIITYICSLAYMKAQSFLKHKKDFLKNTL